MKNIDMNKLLVIILVVSIGLVSVGLIVTLTVHNIIIISLY